MDTRAIEIDHLLFGSDSGPRGAWFRHECNQPLCGVDFCEACGDCLHCYPDECYRVPDGAHLWVVEYTPTAADQALLDGSPAPY